MEYAKRKKIAPSSGAKTYVDESSDPSYNNNSFYALPPTEEIQLEEFETLALDRLKVLRTIDQLKIRGVKGKEFDTEVSKVLNSVRLEFGKRKDVISHFILRLAFARITDRKWFLNQEAALFRYRLSSNYISNYVEIMKQSNMKYQTLSSDEFSEWKEDLKEMEHFVNTREKYFKVPFEEAAELVRQRKVLLRKGSAIVPEDEFTSILVGHFRAQLSESLARAYKAYANVTSKLVTVMPFLINLSNLSVQQEYKIDPSKRSGKVEISQLDMLSQRSYPLCMKNLHSKLREKHHLKHMGRMQYGLFLKGIGLTLEEALIFWRSEFTQLMGTDKFEKNYSYNIRHNYGKEGKRADYTPYSCLKIITGAVSSGESHGCPFRHYDADHLKSTLTSVGISLPNISEVQNLVKGAHFQIACAKYFELTHPNSKNIVINHPNQYFDESEKHFNPQQQHSSDSKSSTSNPKDPSNSNPNPNASTSEKREIMHID